MLQGGVSGSLYAAAASVSAAMMSARRCMDAEKRRETRRSKVLQSLAKGAWP
mgnify:CR=1 FL=1